MVDYDVVVIGGGHAGTEAAYASARMGSKTALITLDPSRIGVLSCNPAMGGLAKGQLIKEIDALGGIMGRMTDRSAIQYRRLNSSKGPAVRSSRAQCDKDLYPQEVQNCLFHVEHLSILSAEVTNIEIKFNRVSGVTLADGSHIRTQNVIVTSGTFLKAVMHFGEEKRKGGRLGDQGADSLSDGLKALGFRLRRLKTGTPPRLDKKTIQWDKAEIQWGDSNPIPFSFYQKLSRFPYLPQVPCHITYTNERTHEIIERNFSRSPMFNGQITGIGPRYCPSIEDKVSRFRDKQRHQIFLEPEGLNSDEIYVNGISTSLPKDVQEAFVHSIEGLEEAEFKKFGYAVEYDAIDARDLSSTLESKEISGLFFAGQVNGTSGYEEAGGQGLIAGINACLRAQERDPFRLTRMDGYLGVLIDDLILKGSDEPYRMFTSRCEYRLLQREDNADLRLSQYGFDLGLLCLEDFEKFLEKKDRVNVLRGTLTDHYVLPSEKQSLLFEKWGFNPLKDRVSGESLMKRPEISFPHLEELGIKIIETDSVIREQVEIQVKYSGYIQRDMDLMAGIQKNESLKIPKNTDFSGIGGISNEIKGRLKETRPETIGQLSRIQGVTPAAVANVLIYLKSKTNREINDYRS
ncbi:MAG: tRNA uridine-5-carboxymethylaminomethyl(34) synthesis enzyme MnmG [Bdellovibrionaceae bacterium]|nr:tRNA uridine-5-carboxymethylaminomethyl(34) synthesis enzyme MnmG [Pseudobdellovibrionaceae bacterium]